MSGTETSTKRIEANRRNARKSTGPKTEEGKARSRFNAVKHGMRAATPTLPGEDPAALQARLDSWTATLKPADDVERFLVGRAVQLSWQLERSDCALSAHRDEHADGATRMAEEVMDLGRRLFHDPRSPIGLYPTPAVEYGMRVSLSDRTYSSDEPARLLNQLEATAMGCAWLLDRWAELRDLLESGRSWLPPDRFRAVRLLGHQPMDLIDDRRLMMIYVACAAMGPDGDDPFIDIVTELGDRDWERFSGRIEARKSLAVAMPDPEAGRSALRAMIAEEEQRLEELLSLHLERGPVSAEAIAREDHPELERLRRYQAACDRTLLRILETLRKRHREEEAPNEPNVPAVTISEPQRHRDTEKTESPAEPAPNEPNDRDEARPISVSLCLCGESPSPEKTFDVARSVRPEPAEPTDGWRDPIHGFPCTPPVL